MKLNFREVSDSGKSPDMTKARSDGLYLLLLGAVVFVLLGFAFENASSDSMVDFKAHFYTVRCLLQHGDPYKQSDMLRVYQAAEGDHSPESVNARPTITRYPYLPTVFLVTTPFGMLPFGPAHLLWMAANAGGLILASFLIWHIGAKWAPVLSGGLICFMLANGELVLAVGNATGITVGLCAIAVWCFLEDRLVAIGIVCLAISLALKPQTVGLVWLYFLVVGGAHRKRAQQTLLVVVLVSIPVLLWVTHVAPNWMQELHSNLVVCSEHGDINDPGPASKGSHGLAMVISLQAPLSLIRDDPRFYNPISYGICGAFVFVWVLAIRRSRRAPASAWLALAAISGLTMLPVYHRRMDAMLLLLSVPACAMLWAEGGRLAKLALAVTATAFVLTGDIPWAIILTMVSYLHLPETELSRQLVTVIQVAPIPVILLVVSVFYLCVYVRKPSATSRK